MQEFILSLVLIHVFWQHYFSLLLLVWNRVLYSICLHFWAQSNIDMESNIWYYPSLLLFHGKFMWLCLLSWPLTITIPTQIGFLWLNLLKYSKLKENKRHGNLILWWQNFLEEMAKEEQGEGHSIAGLSFGNSFQNNYIIQMNF